MEMTVTVKFLQRLQSLDNHLEVHRRRECFGDGTSTTTLGLLILHDVHGSVSPRLRDTYSQRVPHSPSDFLGKAD